MEIGEFINRWSKSLDQGSAAIFIGAGLSRRANYPDWQTLLADIAKELGLDIEAEHDLAAVAQYSLNKAARKRNRLTRLIVDHFPPKPDAPEPFRILARLPVRHIWTTNYDKLAETAWEQERKLLDVKSRNDDLGFDRSWAHATLYKMHGTVDHPAEVVIAKDDYELYRRERPGFLQVLTGHLVTKQMLFLGFSFTDPNLAHLFASIREAFKDDGPEHYAIVRRPKKGNGPGATKRYRTETVRHALWVEDLQRYGIQCVEVDEFENVDEILHAVELRLASRSVFVCGSFPDTISNDDRRYIEAMAREIGRAIAQEEKRLVSGFGLVVGSAVLAGALEIILAEAAPNLEKGLLLRPFPQTIPKGLKKADFYKRYRDTMVQQAGICIFIGGLKDSGKAQLVIADGVLEEFNATQELDRVAVPIGATGGAARWIWETLARDAAYTLPGLNRKEFNQLNMDGLSPADAAKLVTKVLRARDGAATKSNRKR
jgi:hypothetical protein